MVKFLVWRESIKRMNILTAISGLFISAKLPQVFITPTTKKSTKSEYPIACNAPCISVMTFHISPPLNCSGDCVIKSHISLNLSFQVSSAFCRFWTTQLLDSIGFLPSEDKIMLGTINRALFFSWVLLFEIYNCCHFIKLYSLVFFCFIYHIFVKSRFRKQCVIKFCFFF